MLTLLSTVDSALSRFDPSQLTSQMSMELLVKDFLETASAISKKMASILLISICGQVFTPMKTVKLKGFVGTNGQK